MPLNDSITSYRVQGASAYEGGYVPLQVLGIDYNNITFSHSDGIGAVNKTYNIIPKMVLTRSIDNFGNQGRDAMLTTLQGFNKSAVPKEHVLVIRSFSLGQLGTWNGQPSPAGLYWTLNQITNIAEAGALQTWTISHLQTMTTLNGQLVSVGLTIPAFGNFVEGDESASYGWTGGAKVFQRTRRVDTLSKKINNDLAPIAASIARF